MLIAIKRMESHFAACQSEASFAFKLECPRLRTTPPGALAGAGVSHGHSCVHCYRDSFFSMATSAVAIAVLS